MFADNLTLSTQNSSNSTRNLLELMNKFSKVAVYIINVQKSVAFLYTNNDLPEKEIKRTISFTIALKTIKYSGINLARDVKDLDSENYKILIEIEEDTNKCKDVLCSWTKRNSIIKLSMLHKTIYRFSKIPYQNSNGIFTEIEWNKICMEPQKNLNRQNNPKKEEQGWKHLKMIFLLTDSTLIDSVT